MSILKFLFGPLDPEKQKERESRRYEHEKKIAQSLDLAARLKLAKSPATQAEILYYLAQHDNEPKVRTAVARNDATPHQANRVIAADKDVDVRLALANRLVRLLPELSNDQQSQLYAYTVEALETLASDEVAKIRIVLAETLKKELHAPVHIINRLAQDIERQVAEPILQHCLTVSDEILLDILSGHPASWKVEAISQRKFVSASVSDAIIDAENETAGALLLDNGDADISKPTLFKIAEKAMIFKTWQKPLAVRAFLPPDIAKKMADFVDESVRNLLAKRADLDVKVSEEISKKVREELNHLEEEDEQRLSPEDRVRKLIVENALNEEAVVDSLDRKDRAFTIVAMAALARTSRSNMENIVAMRKAKPLVAVCWRAGLGMRTCLRIQQQIAAIPFKEQLNPRGGTDYPLDPAEIKWQLDFLSLS